jgi:hypothetical protein
MDDLEYNEFNSNILTHQHYHKGQNTNVQCDNFFAPIDYGNKSDCKMRFEYKMHFFHHKRYK